MKIKKRFVCSECGYTASSWIGKCPECYTWNSFIEEIVDEKKSSFFKSEKKDLININEVQLTEEKTIKFKNQVINKFWGDGITLGSFILLSGEPGVGKSTFILFLIQNILNDKKVYYFSGEESQAQIKKRALRINLEIENLFISNENEISTILDICSKNKPDFLIIDSIQTIFSSEVDSAVGSVTQIKVCTEKLASFSKNNSIPIIIIGHITKNGDIAGPKLIEHIVDVVAFFEGDFQNDNRILKLNKNRFGNIDEILVFVMNEKGLNLVENPSLHFIEFENSSRSIAKCKTIIIEGNLPILINVEALVVPSVYANSRRFSEGVDVSRINRIAAILNKHLNENLNNYDIYFNITGGIRTKDVGVDLAIAVAIYSSKNKKEIENSSIFIGELSLTGQICNVKKLEQRINQALKVGIKNIYVPKIKDLENKNNLIYFEHISSAINEFYV